ncbi:LysR family transcriptional regulator [Conexibacter sp. SYSU D00693]|uniref:LysR family transcriptional regulator n=1 Tax=Conexibacter sp. SYSU D00693 TaxID=2812560 RepID=UPI00196B18E8|nr:LysR substrate-binding domain-containing protein [Conexibacter sp. SYSU D00693]
MAAEPLPELSLTGLRVVRQVASSGSFSAAADALDYTQSAVSRQVATVEQAVGAPLFERLPRGVRPTPAGELLLRHAEAILDRVGAAQLALAGLRDEVQGRLALGAIPVAMAALVPRAVARLAAQHPGVEVSLSEAGTPALVRRLRAGRLACAVIATGHGLEDPHLDGLETDVLLEGRMFVAVAEGHRLARRATVRPDELEDEPWVTGDLSAAGPQFGAWPASAVPRRTAFATREWSTRLGLVAAGLGVAVVPEVLAPVVPAGIVLLDVDDPGAVRRGALAVTQPDRSPGLAALVRALRAEGGALVSGGPR